MSESQQPAAGPSIGIEGQATAEEVAAVTAALAVVLASVGEPELEQQSGWVTAARLEAQGHPQVSTLRHLAAHATSH